MRGRAILLMLTGFAGVLATWAVAGQASAVTAPSGWPVPYVSERYFGLSQPLFVTGDGSGDRIYIVERAGRILVTPPGGTPKNPSASVFLDVRGKTTTDSERGLLGLAFAPDYASNGRFYVNYTDKAGDTHIARFRRDPADPNKALPDSETTILTVEQPYANHNGGWLGFGPDRYLYCALGDGGSGGDPQGSAQKLSTLLGKMLRIDVEGSTGKYDIPPSNPFVGVPGARAEIWSLGLRNPWRCSFASDGTLYVADVGQSRREEVNVEPPSIRGRNYGWKRWEGTYSYAPGTGVTSSPGGLQFPQAEIAHETAESVTGGYRYEGAAHPGMRGIYLFGDYVLGKIWGLRRTSSGSWSAPLLYEGVPNVSASAMRISSFGVDDAANLYVCDFSAGSVYEVGDANTYSTRVAGSDRYATSVAVALRAFPAWEGVTDVVIASGEDRAASDPLSAAGLAWAYDAPLLLVSSRTVTSDVKAAIGAIEAANGRLTFHVAGGPIAVPEARLKELVDAAGGNAVAERVTGVGDRFDLAAAIARRMRDVRPGDIPGRALIANGLDAPAFYDALALSAVTAKTGSPVLLTTFSSAPSATTGVLSELGLADRWSAGGPKALAPSLLDALAVPSSQRLAGADRYGTAEKVARAALAEGWLAAETVGLAASLPDAATGGAAIGGTGGPVLLVRERSATPRTIAFLADHRGKVTDAWVFGGGVAVSDETRGDIARALE